MNNILNDYINKTTKRWKGMVRMDEIETRQAVHSSFGGEQIDVMSTMN